MAVLLGRPKHLPANVILTPSGSLFLFLLFPEFHKAQSMIHNPEGSGVIILRTDVKGGIHYEWILSADSIVYLHIVLKPDLLKEVCKSDDRSHGQDKLHGAILNLASHWIHLYVFCSVKLIFAIEQVKATSSHDMAFAKHLTSVIKSFFFLIATRLFDRQIQSISVYPTGYLGINRLYFVITV